jgi:hypothetical protein
MEGSLLDGPDTDVKGAWPSIHYRSPLIGGIGRLLVVRCIILCAARHQYQIARLRTSKMHDFFYGETTTRALAPDRGISFTSSLRISVGALICARLSTNEAATLLFH